MYNILQIKVAEGPTFNRTVKLVKDCREARYEPATKTWWIPGNARLFNAGINRGEYRYEIVRDYR